MLPQQTDSLLRRGMWQTNGEDPIYLCQIDRWRMSALALLDCLDYTATVTSLSQINAVEVRTKVDDTEVGVEEPELGLAWVLEPVVEVEGLVAAPIAWQVHDPDAVTFRSPLAVIIVPHDEPSHGKL
ncbi:hypothetical protein INT43_005804 [Umbelopsis isabellina]|uniref:Uncharacterized protein n=1 Tax=Mortierella isabellina TaxID=91625 RepID=A0A8H7PIW1_MORIS|nr:hypothetical protein INT43_005804 [Umbelopsis isabellina]